MSERHPKKRGTIDALFVEIENIQSKRILKGVGADAVTPEGSAAAGIGEADVVLQKLKRIYGNEQVPQEKIDVLAKLKNKKTIASFLAQTATEVAENEARAKASLATPTQTIAEPEPAKTEESPISLPPEAEIVEISPDKETRLIRLIADLQASRDRLLSEKTGEKDDHWYDVQTKFDLAQAYAEMGDEEGTREILEEIVKEGDARQQEEANNLLQNFPEAVQSVAFAQPALIAEEVRADTTIQTEADQQVDRANLEANANSSVQPTATPEVVEMRADPEGAPPGINLKDENTRAGWSKHLSDLIARAKGKLYKEKDVAKESFSVSERGEKLRMNLLKRTGELDKKAEGYGEKVEKFIRAKGEEYNKLSLTKKLALGAVLGIGAAAFSTVSTPLATAFAINLGIQRFGGMASMFLKAEKFLQDHTESQNSEQDARYRKMSAALLTAGYTVLMSSAIGTAVEAASSSAWGEAVHEWLKHYYPFGQAETVVAGARPEIQGRLPDASAQAPVTQPAAPPTPDSATTPPTVDASAAAAAAERVSDPTTTVPDVQEVASVEAKAGQGYERMMEKLLKSLPGDSDFPSGSPMRELLDADPKSLNTVLHRIAEDNGWFNKDGTSVRINIGDKMTVDSNGDIWLGDTILAPKDAPTTPAYNPDAPASHASSSVSPEKDSYSDSFDIEDQGLASMATHTTEAPHAPIADTSPNKIEETILQKPTNPAMVDLTQGNIAEIGQNGFVNSHGIPINPDVTHGYSVGNRMYIMGGNGDLDAQAQEYAQKNNVSVFVDKSYSWFGFTTNRVVEFAPTNDGPPNMIIHKGPSLVPDPKNFTKRIF